MTDTESAGLEVRQTLETDKNTLKQQVQLIQTKVSKTLNIFDAQV